MAAPAPMASCRCAARVAAGAESELIVPADDGGPDHPDAVAETKRVILLDVAQAQASGGRPLRATGEPG